MKVLLLFFLLSSQIIFSQVVDTDTPTSVEWGGLKGKVKENRCYRYDNLPIEAFDDTENFIKKKSNLLSIHKYDSEGFLMKNVFYRRYNTIKVTEYEHYFNGKLKQIRSFEKGTRKLEEKITDYSYDKLGRLSQIRRRIISGKWELENHISTYEYTPTKIRVFDENQQIKKIQYLDSLSRVVKSVNYKDGDSVSYITYDYIYREKTGKITRVTLERALDENMDEKFTLNRKYIYDDKGNLIETLNLDGTKQESYYVPPSDKYKYETVESEGNTFGYVTNLETGIKKLYRKNIIIRDDKGNIIKKCYFSNLGSDDEKMSLYEYEIIYWKD